MFSLIITIISIALVAALALATIYYGGTAFNRGSADAKASQLINEGQQLNGAVTMNKADAAAGSATAATTLADLVTGKYLAQLPVAWAGTQTVATGFAVTAAVADDVCTSVNTKAGATAVAETAIATATTVYGCTSDSKKVFYKF